jgi:hypothetical protein
MPMSRRERSVARFSLAAVWGWTALVSAQQADGLSRDLLAANPHIPVALHAWIIWSGAGVDLLLGLLLACWPRTWVTQSAWVMTLLMTLVATVVDPGLWLHPLGPLSKNLPILALLWLLSRNKTS